MKKSTAKTAFVIILLITLVCMVIFAYIDKSNGKAILGDDYYKPLGRGFDYFIYSLITLPIILLETVAYQAASCFFICKPSYKSSRIFVAVLLVLSAAEIMSVILGIAVSESFLLAMFLITPVMLFVELAYFITWLKLTIQKKKAAQ
ncbi:MAG: hypothetical protein LUH43_03620 [Clostridia bacterium]|nr:hypothetical protein [Clostridia bacterium]